MAEELTAKDVIRAHARDELGIDMDAMANPFQASAVSAIAFTAGSAIPLHCNDLWTPARKVSCHNIVVVFLTLLGVPLMAEK